MCAVAHGTLRQTISAALLAAISCLTTVTTVGVYVVFVFPFFKPLALRGRYGGAEGRRGVVLKTSLVEVWGRNIEIQGNEYDDINTRHRMV